LRNPDRVATNLAAVNFAALEPAQVRVLFEPRFTIRPDESHLEKNSAKLKAAAKGADPGLESAFRKINEMNARPEKIAVLYGDPRSPYVRVDPYFMDELADDAEAQQALDALIRVIDAEVRDLVLEPGDFVFIDNFKAVHGRRAFRARYDGNDRWLKRINLARDLRKSRDARPSCESRILS
jgi:Fe(II)/alpha-ketoglutarate-dependent arginine beta-hydroxylase